MIEMNDRASTLDLTDDTMAALRHAARTAAMWDVALHPTSPGSFPQRVLNAREKVQRIEAHLAGIQKQPNADSRISALLDVRNNPRLLRSTVMAVTRTPGDREELPRILSPHDSDEPRLAGLSHLYLRACNDTIKAESFVFFLRELQAHEPLTLLEIWNVPSYLNFALLEQILEETELALRDTNPITGVRLSILMDSLRESSSIDWAPLLESLIVLDEHLRQDPTGTFSRMDFDSRQLYRDQVALLARHSDCSESQVATIALQLAREGAQRSYSDPRLHQRMSHVGYYLVDKGIDLLATRVNFHPPLSYRIQATLRRNPDDFYITGIELITVFFIAAVIFPLLPNYPVNGKLVITFLMMIMPAMQCAVELMNNSISAIFNPARLPKLDFSQGIPIDCTTLVVVPTLLLNEEQVREMASELEVRFLANNDANLHFALLTDLPDSVSKPHANDSSPLVDLAVELINDLNARYARQGNSSFLLLHRHRIFNVRQGVWMGWERKRGKLLDLNKLLMGEYDAFPIKAGRLEALRSVRYILTLDSDTQLPRGSAARMVGTMTHPLNQAIIDPALRIVVEGYGILQPRVGVSVSSTSRSRLAALYSGPSGFDIYTRAISDAYQDLYGEGIFTGKGLYEVAALHAVLNHRFPRNSLLSHDLIEGAYARAGLVTDIELVDDYPSHYSAYTRRKHRWVRGDWQIAQWMFSRVPDESGKKVPNPISTVSRWKIFDNLRRSLVEPFTFFLFIAGWIWLPGGPLYWTLVPLLLFFFPTMVQTAFGLGRAAASRREGEVPQALSASGHAALVTLLNLFFLPHQAMLVLDAVCRALIRRFITGERLLEWETAAEAESHTRRTTPVDRYLALMPVLASVIAVILFLRHSEALLIACPILLGWCMATVLTAWLNRPPRERKDLEREDRELLLTHALRIWRYFSEFGNAAHNFLIPDNVEERDLSEAARVSPTNIGLLLNARQAACEFGFLTVPEFSDLTRNTLATITRLEKMRGHLYNWYDTRTAQPLEANPFISTVDSGNLVASLYTLHTGARMLLSKPLLSPTLFAGLRPHWQLLQEQGRLPDTIAKLSLPPENASISEWLEWLPPAAIAFAHTIPSGSDPWHHSETQCRIDALLSLVRNYLPWLDPQFAALRQASGLPLDVSSERLNIDQAIQFAETLQARLVPFVESPGDRQEAAKKLQELLPAAIGHLRELAGQLREISQDAFRLAEETDFRFLINPNRHILSIGYDVRAQKTHTACYDMLASEARIATFLAVARGEIPQQSWFRLSRDHAHAFGFHVLLSWTGTMFEYLMPALWMQSYPNTLISNTLIANVRVQQAFGRSLGIPWGISESGAARRDDSGNYTYYAYGIPQIALSWEADAGPIVSPYSTFLALAVDPFDAIANLRRMAAAGWVGSYGFYESIDYTASSQNGEVVREWMAHHQGMSLLAILNCLNGKIVQHWFHANPVVQSSEILLHELPVSKAALKARMKDFTNVASTRGKAA